MSADDKAWWALWVFGVLVFAHGIVTAHYVHKLREWLRAQSDVIQSLSRSQDLNDQQFKHLFAQRDWQHKPAKEWPS